MMKAEPAAIFWLGFEVALISFLYWTNEANTQHIREMIERLEKKNGRKK